MRRDDQHSVSAGGMCVTTAGDCLPRAFTAGADKQPLMRRHNLARPLGDRAAFRAVEQSGFTASARNKNAVESGCKMCLQIANERFAREFAGDVIERGHSGGEQAAKGACGHECNLRKNTTAAEGGRACGTMLCSA